MKLMEYLNHEEITQAGFARKTGIGKRTISKICKQNYKVVFEIAVLIEKYTRGKVLAEEVYVNSEVLKELRYNSKTYRQE